MHLAVLIYGRLNKCIEHYDNIIEHIGREHTIDFFCSSDNSDKEFIKYLIQYYKPVSYNNDPIEYEYNFNNYYILEGYNLNNMIRHFINKNRVFSLLENYMEIKKVNYDMVISLRVDSLFHTPFIFKEFQENTIYIPLGDDWLGGINDQIAYGKIDVMKKYMNIIHNCQYLLENNLSKVHPESLVRSNLMHHNINISRVNISYIIDK